MENPIPRTGIWNECAFIIFRLIIRQLFNKYAICATNIPINTYKLREIISILWCFFHSKGMHNELCFAVNYFTASFLQILPKSEQIMYENAYPVVTRVFTLRIIVYSVIMFILVIFSNTKPPTSIERSRGSVNSYTKKSQTMSSYSFIP